MDIYLVGGAVRDQLLGLPVKEKDWVVVGATVEEMLRKGFRQVGKDFPVFLHPKTNEEYALARIERKVGRGYAGFDFDASISVSLEEDLKRRDLTINAIAQTAEGVLVDPYHGVEDLNKKILRHVSPAFTEDPVRILRVARFAARYVSLGFTLAPETLTLMQEMVASGEVDALVAERVWKELERALAEKNPEQFFQILSDCHALPILFPQWELCLDELAKSTDTQVRFAVLCSRLSLDNLNELCNRYRVPSDYRELAVLVIKHLHQYECADKLAADELQYLLQVTDAFRREERFNKFLLACEIGSHSDQSTRLQACLVAAKAVDIKEVLHLGVVGKEIAVELNKLRITAIANHIHKS